MLCIAMQGVECIHHGYLKCNLQFAGNVAQWGGYTTGANKNVEIPDGTHYFVSTHYLEVTKVCIVAVHDIRSHS